MVKQPSRSWQFVVSLTCIGLVAYFAYHAVSGRHGLERRLQLQREAARLERELEQLAAERSRLEHRVALLANGRVHPDMLSEQARRLLNYSHPDDIILIQIKDTPAGRP